MSTFDPRGRILGDMLSDNAIRSFLRAYGALRHVLRRLGLPRPRFTRVEALILNAVATELSEADRKAMSVQLSHVDLIQRTRNRRLAVSAIFLDKVPELPLLSLLGPSFRVAMVSVAAGKSSVRATVLSHRGRVASIDFKGALDELGDSPKVVSVELGKGFDAAVLIDREEHGENA